MLQRERRGGEVMTTLGVEGPGVAATTNPMRELNLLHQ